MSDERDDNQARPVGPDGELETVRETVTRVGKLIEQRDELIKLWALAPTWTLREGACLANNVSPRLLSEHGNFPRRHPAAERVNRLIEFALRSMRQFKLSTDPTPAVFIAWSENVGFPFDAKWIEVIGKPRIPAGPGAAVGSAALAAPRPAESAIDESKDGALSSASRFRETVEAAYQQRVEEWPKNKRHPTGEEDFKWMKNKFGVKRARARKIRQKFALATWKAKGAPKSISK